MLDLSVFFHKHLCLKEPFPLDWINGIPWSGCCVVGSPLLKQTPWSPTSGIRSWIGVGPSWRRPTRCSFHLTQALLLLLLCAPPRSSPRWPRRTLPSSLQQPVSRRRSSSASRIQTWRHYFFFFSFLVFVTSYEKQRGSLRSCFAHGRRRAIAWSERSVKHQEGRKRIFLSLSPSLTPSLWLNEGRRPNAESDSNTKERHTFLSVTFLTSPSQLDVRLRKNILAARSWSASLSSCA